MWFNNFFICDLKVQFLCERMATAIATYNWTDVLACKYFFDQLTTYGHEANDIAISIM